MQSSWIIRKNFQLFFPFAMFLWIPKKGSFLSFSSKNFQQWIKMRKLRKFVNWPKILFCSLFIIHIFFFLDIFKVRLKLHKKKVEKMEQFYYHCLSWPFTNCKFLIIIIIIVYWKDSKFSKEIQKLLRLSI